MPIVATHNLMDGMVLAEAATAAGKEIVPAGAQVDRAAVARLAAAGVAKVRVTEESHGLAALVLDTDEAQDVAVRAAKPRTGVREKPAKPADTTQIQANLMRVAHMFNDYRDDKLMRELCRLAIKCAQERLISV